MIWEEILNRSDITGVKIHHTFQEDVQKAILTSLSREKAFNDIVFQGGTSLRFFYGNPRFSEDLDFVLRYKKDDFDFTKILIKIKRFVNDVFPFLDEVKISIQKNDSYIQRLILRTFSDISEQKLRIHIELAYIPSYHNQPRILNFPPFNPAVRVEDLSEILADKITAIGGRSYLKGRDIWDIYFLTNEKQISVPWDLVFQKAKDYGDSTDGFKEKLLLARNKIKDNGLSILSNEMRRFLPKMFLDQYKEMFDKIIISVAEEVELIKNIQKR